MRCLEKDRTRRYETANGLADDLKRHLRNEPVVACPPSQVYRLKKLVRRNRLAFAAAAAITASVCLGLGTTTAMFFKEQAAKEQAERARKDEAQMRRQAEAAANTARTLAEVRRLNSQALLLATCVPTLGDSRTPAALRALEQAEKAAQTAGELSLKLGPDHSERGALMVTTALLRSFRGQPEGAETLARNALGVLPQGHPDAILANILLSGSLRAQGRLAEATRIDRELPSLARTATQQMQREQDAERARQLERITQITCTNNLKQIGLAFQTWAIEHEGAFPFNVPRAKGGTLELSSAGANGFEQNPASHFLVMSNELMTPKILVCFADSSKAAADNFQDLALSNITYQIRSGPTIMPNSTNEVLVRCPIHGYQLNCGTLEIRAAKGELK
jgi:hypothetical protein